MPIHLHKQVKAPAFTKQLASKTYETVKQHVKYPRPFQVNVVAVSRPAIQKLNQVYRDVNKVTDVLSFPYGENEGEIVICYQQAVKQAKEKQTGVKEELEWLLVHGILHLLGYDHESAADAKAMRPLEQKILQDIKQDG